MVVIGQVGGRRATRGVLRGETGSWNRSCMDRRDDAKGRQSGSRGRVAEPSAGAGLREIEKSGGGRGRSRG